MLTSNADSDGLLANLPTFATALGDAYGEL